MIRTTSAKTPSIVGTTLFTSLSRAAVAGKATPEQLAAVQRTARQIFRLLPLLEPIKQSPEALLDALQKIAGEPSLYQGMIQTLGPEMQLHFRNQALSLERITGASKKIGPTEREWLLYEVEAVRTAVLASYAELQRAEQESYAANYPGIRRYRMAVRGRIKDLDRIEKSFQKGDPLPPRLEERWARLRMSYLGEEETGYRGKVQQHLDLLRELHLFIGKESADPLLDEMNARREAYANAVGRIVRADEGKEPDAKMEDLQKDRDRVERLYEEAFEAWFFLSGLMPTGWMGSLKEIGREVGRQLPQLHPAVWLVLPLIVPLIPLISVFLFLGVPFLRSSFLGEPMTLDGALFPAVHKRWEDGTLVIEPVYPVRKGGLSRRALGAAILDTIIMQLSLVKTAGLDTTRSNLDGLAPGWLHTVLTQAGATLRMEGLDHLKGLRDENLILAPTHRGFIEFPLMLGVEHYIGRPNRIMAKDGFRKNPAIRGIVGLAMEKYEFIFIDRTAGRDARETMVQAGEKLKAGTKSILLFPGMSRSPTLVFDGERVEGPHYQSKEGIGVMANSAGDPWIIPIAVIGSGKMTPKDLKEQSRGIPVGMTITIKFGRPFRASSVIRNEKMTDRQYWQAVAAKIDDAHREMTGLPTGPLYRAKGPKTIFQADGIRDLRREMKKRLKNPRKYKHSAVVFSPKYRYMEGEENEVITLLKELKFSNNDKLTVFHAVQKSDGGYEFPAYHVVRKRTSDEKPGEFEIVRD